MQPFRAAISVTWILVSAVLMTAVLAPYLIPAPKLYSLFPVCEAKLQGGSCVLCGMTTAYIRLASGDLPGALEANRFALALWLGSILNFAIAKAYILIGLLRRPRHAGGFSL